MECIKVKEFQIGKTRIPSFSMRRGVPTCIVWPGIIDKRLIRQICNAIKANVVKNNFSSRFVFVSSQIAKPFFLNYGMTSEKIINKIPKWCQPEFVTKVIGDKLTAKPWLLGMTERLLLNMARFAIKDGILIFSTSGIDPKGCESLLAYGKLISEETFVIHIEFPSNIPNCFGGWELIRPCVSN